jgi:hypothetical protein
VLKFVISSYANPARVLLCFRTAADVECFQKKRNLLHINVLRSSAYIMSDEVL